MTFLVEFVLYIVEKISKTKFVEKISDLFD